MIDNYKYRFLIDFKFFLNITLQSSQGLNIIYIILSVSKFINIIKNINIYLLIVFPILFDHTDIILSLLNYFISITLLINNIIN